MGRAGAAEQGPQDPQTTLKTWAGSGLGGGRGFLEKAFIPEKIPATQRREVGTWTEPQGPGPGTGGWAAPAQTALSLRPARSTALEEGLRLLKPCGAHASKGHVLSFTPSG